MFTNRRRTAVLVAAAGVPFAVAAPMTATEPRCSLQLNTKIQVHSPRFRIGPSLASDCRAAGTDTARWDVTHRTGGVVSVFSFADENLEAQWPITDETQLGAYDIVAAGAFDEDSAGGQTPVSQNALRPWRHQQVRIWFRICQLCQLHEMRPRRTDHAGRFSFRVYSSSVRRWRARTDDRPYTWGASIVGNPGERIG